MKVKNRSGRIPDAVIAKYPLTDVDTGLLLANFDELPGSRVLEVGAHDEPVANILAESGYQVIGIDLREYGPWQDVGTLGQDIIAKPNYEYLRADFCDLPSAFIAKWLGKIDAVVSLSAIEHFGLGTYGEGSNHPYYDVIAMRLIWRLLREGGTAYVTVPFGSKFKTCGSHWRVYDTEAMRNRIVQDFVVEKRMYAVVGPGVTVDGVELGLGPVPWEIASRHSNSACPHLTAFFKLRKIPVNRMAIDGR